MSNPYNVPLLTTDGLEAAWTDKCPGCGAEVSAIKHDFSLCTRLNNAEYRIRELEAQYSAVLNLLRQSVVPAGTRRGEWVAPIEVKQV